MELQLFLDLLNYLSKFSLVNTEVCKPLCKWTSVKADIELNYQDLYNKAKKIVMKDACMKFHDATRPLCLETDVSGVSLGARLLQVRDGMNYGCNAVPDNATMCLTALPASH